MPPSHGPGGEREDGGGQEVFAQGQAEEVSQYLGQWGHGDEPLVVDAPFVPFGDHAAGDLGGAHDKQDEGLQDQQRDDGRAGGADRIGLAANTQ